MYWNDYVFVISLIIFAAVLSLFKLGKFAVDFSTGKIPKDQIACILIVIVSILMSISSRMSPNFRNLNYEIPIQFNIIGIFLMLEAFMILYKATSDLGNTFADILVVDKTKPLITSGIYYYIRHPMYTGIILWLIGLMLLVPNVIGITAAVTAISAIISCRIPNEEQDLIATYGDAYLEYMTNTKRLIPFIY